MQGELKRSLKPFPKEHDSFTEWELGAGGGGGGSYSGVKATGIIGGFFRFETFHSRIIWGTHHLHLSGDLFGCSKQII